MSGVGATCPGRGGESIVKPKQSPVTRVESLDCIVVDKSSRNEQDRGGASAVDEGANDATPEQSKRLENGPSDSVVDEVSYDNNKTKEQCIDPPAVGKNKRPREPETRLHLEVSLSSSDAKRSKPDDKKLCNKNPAHSEKVEQPVEKKSVIEVLQCAMKVEEVGKTNMPEHDAIKQLNAVGEHLQENKSISELIKCDTDRQDKKSSEVSAADEGKHAPATKDQSLDEESNSELKPCTTDEKAINENASNEKASSPADDEQIISCGDDRLEVESISNEAIKEQQVKMNQKITDEQQQEYKAVAAATFGCLIRYIAEYGTPFQSKHCNQLIKYLLNLEKQSKMSLDDKRIDCSDNEQPDFDVLRQKLFELSGSWMWGHAANHAKHIVSRGFISLSLVEKALEVCKQEDVVSSPGVKVRWDGWGIVIGDIPIPK